MERPGRDKQDVIGSDHAVLGVDGRAFHEWQQVSLHALARYVSANRFRAPGDFVEFIEKNDAVLFDRLECA